MKRVYQITSVIFFAFAAFIAWEAYHLKMYTSLGPGPGFFPFWLSVIFGGLSAMMFYHATFGRSDPMPSDFWANRQGYLRVLAITVALIFTVLFMNAIGFRITMLAFFLFLLVALGRQNPIVTIAVALAGSLGTYYVFVNWLKVPLPVGVIDEIIFDPWMKAAIVIRTFGI